MDKRADEERGVARKIPRRASGGLREQAVERGRAEQSIAGADRSCGRGFDRTRSPIRSREGRGSEHSAHHERGRHEKEASPCAKREHSRGMSEGRPVRRQRTGSGAERHRHASKEWRQNRDERERDERRIGAGRERLPFVKLDGNAINVKGDVRANIDRIFNKQINDCKSASDLCTLMLLGNNLQNLNAIHTSNAIDTLGKRLTEQASDRVNKLKLEDAVHGLAEHLIDIMTTPDFADNVRALATSLHGFALIHCAGVTQVSRNTRLKLALAEHINRVLHDMRPWDINQTLWSFAKLGWCTTDVQTLLAGIDARCCDLFDAISRAKESQELQGFDKFEGVDIANILQALCHVDPAECQWKPSEGLLRRLEIHAADEAWDLTHQGVVTVVTGFAKLERDPPVAVKAQICLRAMKVMGGSASHDVSNLFWGMAKGGWQPPAPLIDILFQRLKALHYEFNRQEIVNMFWSTAMMNVRLGPGQQYWEGMMERMCEMAPEFNAQDMSMFFHALGVMAHPFEAVGRHRLQPFLDRLEEAMFRSSPPSVPQNLVQIFRAFAHLQVPCELLPLPVSVLSERALMLMDRFNGQDLSGLYWSFATLNQRPGEELMRRMTCRLVKIQKTLNSQDTSLIAWSLRTGAWHMPGGGGGEARAHLPDLTDPKLGIPCTHAAAIPEHVEKDVYDPSVAIGVLHESSLRIIDQFLPRDFASVFCAASGLDSMNRQMGWPERPEFVMDLCDGLNQQIRDKKMRLAHLRTGSLDARDLAQILHSIACYSHYLNSAGCWKRLEDLLLALSHICSELIPIFCVKDIDNVSYACDKLTWSVDRDRNVSIKERILTQLLKRAQELMDQVDEHCLAQLVSAMVHSKEEGCDVSVDLISQCLAEFSMRMAELLKGMCPVQTDSARLADMHTFMWALGRLQVRPRSDLRESYVAHITANIDSIKSRRLVTLLWVSANAPPQTEPGSREQQAEMSLLASILARLKENAGKEELPWSDAASVLWSLVAMSPDLDFSEPQICTGFRELVECYALRLERICESMPAWDSKATPPGGVSPVPSPSPVSDTTVDKLEAFERSDLCMLHQFFLSCAIDERFAAAVGDAGCRMHRVRGHFAKVCKQAFVQANMKTTKSDFHTRVYNVLKHGLGLDVEDEFRCMQSGYTVDLKVTRACPLKIWSVEVNGPSHYLLGAEHAKGDSRMGGTRLKMHHLTLLGYDVVTVPYWDWDKIDYRSDARQEDQVAFLQNALALECAGGSARSETSATGRCCTVPDAPLACPLACSSDVSLDAAELSLAETPEAKGGPNSKSSVQQNGALSDGQGAVVV